MNGGKSRKPHSSGYTILEVMIFLAISGFMFVVAASFMSGRQARAEFTQSVQDINSQIRSVINDVNNGYSPDGHSYNCVVGASRPTFSTAATSNQGGNLGCVFLGKVIQFHAPTSEAGAPSDTNYALYTVTGRQYVAGTTDNIPANFTDAMPTLVYQPGVVDLTEYREMQWGIRVTGAFSGGAPIGAIGFFGSFGNYGSGGLDSGSQSVLVATVPNSHFGDTVADMRTKVETITTDISNPDITLCFEGSDGRKASITIGSINGQRLTTDIQMALSGPQMVSSRC